MSFMTTRKCCFCINLRTGCFIIAYLLLIERLIALTLVSMSLSGINSNLDKFSTDGLLHSELGISKMILSFKILLLSFEILLCLGLINGLIKKIQDQIQMFYIGGWFFFVLRLIMFIIVSMHYGPIMKKKFDSAHWCTYVAEIFGLVLTLYFFAVIRSYYYALKSDYKNMNIKNNFANNLKV